MNEVMDSSNALPKPSGNVGAKERLTTVQSSVNVNHIRGDQEFMKEIQPQRFEAKLWPVHLAHADVVYLPPPTDGSQEAPGAHPPKPNVSE